MTSKPPAWRVSLPLLGLTVAAGPLVGQAGRFPWKHGDPPPVIAGVHLGDRRARVDSLLGLPSHSRVLKDSAVTLVYQLIGMVLVYSESHGVRSIMTTNPSVVLGGVQVGLPLSGLRDRWGAPDREEEGDTYYSAGDWIVFANPDSAGGHIVQLGVRWNSVLKRFELPDTTDIFRVVAGTWDWAHEEKFCQANPHTISFSATRDTMILTDLKPDTLDDGTVQGVWRYEIRGHTRSSIRGFIQGETRRTDAGELVVWDLVLMSPDVYRWHRADWEPEGLTGEIRRCPKS